MAAKSKEVEFGQSISNFLVLRGVLAIIFGVIVLVWPGLTVATFSVLLALWLLLSGVVGIIVNIMNREGNWVLKMLVAVFEIGAGAYLVQRPAVTAATLIAITSILFITSGIVEIIAAFTLNDKFNWVDLVFGTLGVVAGMMIWRYPVSGILAVVWVFGLYAVISGTFRVIAGFEMHSELKKLSS